MINLLPPKIKHGQKLGQISRQINSAIFALLIMLSLTYSAVFFVDYFLASQLKKSDENLKTATDAIAKMKSLENDVTKVNQKLTKIDTLKSQRFEWSAVLSDINNSIPTNVRIDNLQIDKKNSKITLNAAAETRSDIVKLQAKLEDLPYFKNMSFQSSVFDDTNNYYTFSMTGTLGK